MAAREEACTAREAAVDEGRAAAADRAAALVEEESALATRGNDKEQISNKFLFLDDSYFNYDLLLSTLTI